MGTAMTRESDGCGANSTTIDDARRATSHSVRASRDLPHEPATPPASRGRSSRLYLPESSLGGVRLETSRQSCLTPLTQFRAVAVTVVPEAAALDNAGWVELETAIERQLAQRPAQLRRQLALFLRVIDLAARVRFGRGFARLDDARRTRLLTALQDSPVLLLRRGFWGLRTLVFLGYYTRPATAAAVGYRAHRDGWRARGLPDEDALASARPPAP